VIARADNLNAWRRLCADRWSHCLRRTGNSTRQRHRQGRTM